MKLVRFCGGTMRDALAEYFGEGLTGCCPDGDPQHDEQWWLDRVDLAMNDAGWDDTATAKQRARITSKRRTVSRKKRLLYEADLAAQRRLAIARGVQPLPVPPGPTPQPRPALRICWDEPAIPMPVFA
jgi:hypothetical protein